MPTQWNPYLREHLKTDRDPKNFENAQHQAVVVRTHSAFPESAGVLQETFKRRSMSHNQLESSQGLKNRGVRIPLKS